MCMTVLCNCSRFLSICYHLLLRTEREVGQVEVKEFDAVNEVRVVIAGLRSQHARCGQLVRLLAVELDIREAETDERMVDIRKVLTTTILLPYL